MLINQSFTYCFHLLFHFMEKKKPNPKPKQKASVPLMISPQFSKSWKLGVGGILPQLGLAACFPCNAIFKKNPKQKQKRDHCAFFSNSFKIKNKTNPRENQKQPTQNTPTLLIHLWAKTTQKKTKQSVN